MEKSAFYWLSSGKVHEVLCARRVFCSYVFLSVLHRMEEGRLGSSLTGCRAFPSQGSSHDQRGGQPRHGYSGVLQTRYQLPLFAVYVFPILCGRKCSVRHNAFGYYSFSGFESARTHQRQGSDTEEEPPRDREHDFTALDGCAFVRIW